VTPEEITKTPDNEEDADFYKLEDSVDLISKNFD